MNGLRKVVKLKVYDIPESKLTLNSGKNFFYNWRNNYYIGNFKLYKSKQFNNFKNNGKYNDKYLDKMIKKISINDDNKNDNIVLDRDFLFYTNGESSIYYFGKNRDIIKSKIYKK